MSFLSQKKYLDVIKNTNLISVDLIIYDKDNKILVGKRTNEPAKGFYFVPGSRVRKSETIKEAIRRVCNFELGVELTEPKFSGVYEHVYTNNFVNNDFGTHYLCFGYKFCVDDTVKNKINNSVFYNQHSHILWETEEKLMSNDYVHENCKAYFTEKSNIRVI